MNLPQWTYGTYPVDTPFPDMYGFIYRITYNDGAYYYGKKNFYSLVKLPALKSGEQRPNSRRVGKNKNGKRVYFDEVKKESDWKKYTGSADIDLPIEKREILAYARSKRELTYLEIKCLFQTEALEDELCRNININGTWFRDRLI